MMLTNSARVRNRENILLAEKVNDEMDPEEVIANKFKDTDFIRHDQAEIEELLRIAAVASFFL